MSVRDGIGNEIAVGDLVFIQLDKPFVIGQVVSLRDGGIALADDVKGKTSPGVIQIQCPQTIAFQPGPHARITMMFKITNPQGQEIVDKIANEANLGKLASVATMPKPETATEKPPES